MSVFGLYARYYDLLYRDKDYAAEARFVSDELRSCGREGRTLLELGCGTGRHALAFAELGWSVVGIDLSAAMVERARDRWERASESVQRSVAFREGDVRNLRLDRQFDAAISLFHVMSYQTTDADLAAAFGTAAVHLRPGGLFLFDFWHGPAVIADPPTIRIKRLQDAATEVTRIAEPVVRPECNRVVVNYDIFLKDRASGQISEIREAHELRYLFISDLSRQLAAAGFALHHTSAWLDAEQPLGTDTWYGCAVARRMGEANSL